MNENNLQLAEGLGLSKTYLQLATQSLQQRQNMVKNLLSQRRIPEEGWDDSTIELFLDQIAVMDSNNFISNVGVGEREGRVVCDIVKRRHYALSHGIGRSGELSAEQPKAAGSSLVMKLTQYLVLDAFKLSGLQGITSCIVLPLATGMTLSLSLMALKQKRPQAEYVIWPRIDQKTCLKCIVTAGLKPLVIPNILENDELRTDLTTIEHTIAQYSPDSILCVMTTTSCFAPRAPDRIIEIAKLCKEKNIGHIINNAYGLQSTKYSHLITEACRQGRVDVFVQSTDKNFMVPVGGSVVASTSTNVIDDISKIYPGRASMSPILDLFITLLSLGATGYKRLLQERKENFDYLTSRLAQFASAHNERLLQTPNNPISLAMTLKTFSPHSPSMLGSMLFSRSVSGTRIGVPSVQKTVCNIDFKGYGTHSDAYPHVYLNAACAVGMTKEEIDTFMVRLEKTWNALTKMITKKDTTTSKGSLDPEKANVDNLQ